MFLKSNLLLALIAALSLNTALADDDAGGQDHMGMKDLPKELNLSAEQKEKIKKIREENRDQMKKMREKMHAKMQEFRSKMASDASDGDIKEAHEEMQEMHEDMAEARLEKMLKVRAVLTPEQRKKFMALQEKKMKHMMGKHGKMRGKGKGKGKGKAKEEADTE